MTGVLKITIEDNGIIIDCKLKNTSLADKISVIHALMSCFEMRGTLRRVVCDLLVATDHYESGKTEAEEDVEFIADLLKTINDDKEDVEYEG